MARGNLMSGLFLVATFAASLTSADADELQSAAPSLKGTTALIPLSESVLGLRTRVTLVTLGQLLDQKMPATFLGDANGPDACQEVRVFHRLLHRFCVGTHYNFKAQRTKPIVVSGAGVRLHITTAIRLTGKGGLRGDVPRWFSLSAKNFTAAADVSADIDMHVNTNWCPSVTVDVGYHWTQNPKVEIVSRAWIDVSGKVNDSASKAIADLQGQIRSIIPCDRIKAEASKAWHSYNVPLVIPGEPALYLLLVPTAAGTSGVVIDANEARIAIGLRARTEIADRPKNTADTPLPPLEPVSDAAGELSVLLPIHASYETLANGVNDALKGKSFPFNAAGQSGDVSINGVTVYPSSGNVSIAFDFVAHFSSHLPDVSGKVYATAKPVVGNGGLSIGITDFVYTANLNSTLWSAISFAFKGLIEQSVEQNAKIDLAPRVNAGFGKLQEALSDPTKTKGIKIDVQSPRFGIEKIVPEHDGLTALLDISATLDTTVTELVSEH